MHPGHTMLRQMARARRFNQWMADTIAPFLDGDILEIGAGIGNLTEFLRAGCERYVATDTETAELAELKARFGGNPNLQIKLCDASNPNDFIPLRESFDTVVCLNVLEHIEDDETTLRNIYDALRADGKAIILVPQGPAAFGSLDEVLEHKRRYSKQELRRKIIAAGFHVQKLLRFNRATYPGWFLNSRILRRRTLSDIQLQLFDQLVPLWRVIDRYLPWPSTSLIAVGVKKSTRRHA
jgi:SAM-dependent methyltransferase